MSKIRKIIYVIFLFVLIGNSVFAQEDKRVGLVLSGGTARGLAHIGGTEGIGGREGSCGICNRYKYGKYYRRALQHRVYS